jgi:ribosomal protein L40E
MKRYTEDGYKRTNRELSMEPTMSRSHWCFGCDANLVHDGETCSRCGTTDLKYKAKKPVVPD